MSSPMTDATRDKLLLKLEETARLADNALPSVAAARQLFARLEMNHVAELFRVLEFTLLLQFDLCIIYADYVKSEHKPQAHVYARFVILMIYEGTKTYRRLLGKELQEVLAARDDAMGLIPDIRRAHKALNAVADEAFEKYDDVRNGIAAHRDAEAITHLERLRGIGGEELTDFVLRFLQAAANLQALLGSVAVGTAQSLKNHIRVVSMHPGTQSMINVTAAGESPGESRQVNAQEITWHSSDSAVAEVDTSGTLIAHSYGYARITFRSEYTPEVDGDIFVFVGNDEQLAEMSEAWNAIVSGGP